MKLQVLQENLAKALNLTLRFSSSKVQLPVLANTLFKTQKNKLILSATNLETSISVTIGAKIESEGSITVPSKTVSELVSNLSSGQVELEVVKENLKISSQGFKSNVSGINASDFPSIALKTDSADLQVNSVSFSNALSKVIFAVSSDETRPTLTGVLWIVDGKGTFLVATDGFRLSRKLLPVSVSKKGGGGYRVIVPRNTLSEISRISQGDGDIKVEFKKSENQIILEMPNRCLSSRIIDGDFPSYEKIIPQTVSLSLNVDKDDLLQAVKLASVFARDSANVIKFSVSKDGLLVFGESKISGSQEKLIDAKVEFESDDVKELVVAFNYKFIEEYLNSVSGEDVLIKLIDADSPAVFADPKDSDYLHIIMPIKLQN